MSALDGTRLAECRSWVAGHRDRMVADVVALAELETPSDDPDLLHAGLERVEGWLTALVGAPSERRFFPGDGHGDIVALDFPAPKASEEWVTALCHYDTVWPKGTSAEWPVVVDGDRITGPGVFDMKTGIVQCAWALAAADAVGLDRANVRLVLNGDEETGSPASRPVLESEASKGGPVLVFEASADGAVKTARKGVGIFEIEVRGVEAHAGLDPLAGASAIDEIARIVLALHGATDLENGTSVNVGVLHGGTRGNVKAGRARAVVDVRVSSEREQTRIDAVLASLRPHNPLATVTVTGGWNRPVMERSPLTAALFARAATVAAALGVELREVSVGGASDGNFASALGLPVLDGLGAIGAGAHARTEWVSVDGMLERTVLTAGLLAELA